MKNFMLVNDFHHTTATTRPDAEGYLKPSQVQRAERKLCACDCTCGGAYRAQQLIAAADGGAWIIRDMERA